ncbi:MAG: hypothetical protein AAFP86_17955, partial [Planctomycetota bacterium]
YMDGDAAPAQGGWALLVSDRVQNADRYDAWSEQRASAWNALRSGAFGKVADTEFVLPVGGPAPWPEAEALSLRATAMLADGRPAEAAVRFERAAELVDEWDARFAARARLYAALGLDLSGDPQEAQRARATTLASLRLAEIQDPLVLRLLLEADASTGWYPGSSSRREVRARLGRLELERGAAQAAVLAWRAAESESGARPTRQRLRLNQAEALVSLGQDQAAIAMLAGLAATELRPEALAMLGLIQLRRGQIELALTVFREAVANTTPAAHPGVFADAGLALLSAMNPDAGLPLLHQARDVYAARGEGQALRQLLRNELRYATAAGDSELAADVRQRQLDAPRSTAAAVDRARKTPAGRPLRWGEARGFAGP